MSLKEIRKKIDLVDEEIQALLQKRIELVLSLKPHKTSLVDKEREETILSKIHSSYIREIYRTIFQISIKMLRIHCERDKLNV